ncbi:MAG: hypothetical protein GX896_01890 [Clostridiales bacterium]|nr:hypothetical protein [Clostridiales bacterium]
MLKGINKQIIEIKCPESEHFDKILLFMKCNEEYIPVKHLGSEIYAYYTSLIGPEQAKRKKTRVKNTRLTFLLMFSAVILGLMALLVVLLIL